MTKSAIFFDRDNTLILNDAFLGEPSGVKLIPGAAAAIARARSLGFVIVTASNQSGVARGLYTEEAVQAVNERMDQLLQKENSAAIIDRHEFCPFHPEGTVPGYRKESNLRKPAPGMLLNAADALDIDLSTSWLIGDAPRDIAAGKAAGCRTILINDPSVPPSVASKDAAIAPDEVVANLAEAMDVIEAAASDDSTTAATSRALADLEVSHRRLRLVGGSADEESMAVEQRDPITPKPAPVPAKAATPSPVVDQSPSPTELREVQTNVRQILEHLRQHDPAKPHFSVAKLVAGITQALALAFAVGAFFYHGGSDITTPMLIAIFLQGFTVALLLMGRDR